MTFENLGTKPLRPWLEILAAAIQQLLNVWSDEALFSSCLAVGREMLEHCAKLEQYQLIDYTMQICPLNFENVQEYLSLLTLSP
jgi:hypothetical protein